MKELKTYISEGFFSNIGANNIIKPVIDTIKDASLNDKIDSDKERNEFVILLTSILKDVESDIKKGKFIFKYNRNDDASVDHEITISLEITESGKARWTYSSKNGKFECSVDNIVFNIATDLYFEVLCPTKESSRRHSIAKTIKVIEFKAS